MALSSEKAKKMLSEGMAQGHKLTKKQKRFFGAVAGGQMPMSEKARKAMHK